MGSVQDCTLEMNLGWNARFLVLEVYQIVFEYIPYSLKGTFFFINLVDPGSGAITNLHSWLTSGKDRNIVTDDIS